MASASENRPPTLRTIARVCGVGHATVARALAGHPNVAPATRSRVLEAASRLGYRPDPMLSALSRRRWPDGPRSPTATLAWVYFSDKPGSATGPRAEAQAARRRASELGYGMDVFEVGSLGSGRRLSDVLFARGIRGVLVQAFGDGRALELGWERFCTVFVGPENDEIHVHNVQADFRATVRLAVREALARGYRRPAFALMDYLASGTSEPIYAQVLAERARLEECLGAQPPLFHWHPSRQDLVGPAHRWLRESRADCLIASNAAIYFWLTNPAYFGCHEAQPWSIPEDIAFVSLRGEPAIASLAHTALREDDQAVEAVNLVHRHLQHGHLGSPAVPMRMLVPPVFVQGDTLPPCRARRR